MIRRLAATKNVVRNSARARAGMYYLSLLDMLTCCLGAVLVLWLVSNASVRTHKGISPGTVLKFVVNKDKPNLQGRIGVRLRLKNGGLRWAGDTTPLNPPIIIDQQVEGESSSVTVVLTGEYDDEDLLFVFVHELEGGILWPQSEKMMIDVSRIDEPFDPLEFRSDKLFYSIKLNALREKRGQLEWK